jgi:N-methylhydantoinase A
MNYSSTAARAVVGIDVGGTHTDIVVADLTSGLLWADKVVSNPRAPIEAIRQALATVPAGAPIGLCVNGTTIGINALLQRKLPRIGLVATRGFRDMLYIRRETKANIYDLDWRKPRPLVPRHLTFEVDERLDAEGQVVVPLAGSKPLLDWLERTELNDVAVCLIHAYRNPVHERRIRDAVLEERPETRVTLSSDVWPEWREFERTYNTALNAALKPVIAGYLDGLVAAVREAAGHDDVYLMHADGGVLRPSEIAERPVLTLLSGTVAGALLGARVAEDAGYAAAVSLDMGGTSTDLGFSQNGRPRRSSELSIEWEGTLGFAGIDVVSIGAGGGSIVWADEAGGLHVGPTSAGADPGPACYDQGGTLPALTDAYLLLGYLGPDPIIGGRALDAGRAASVFEDLSARTGVEPTRLCAGAYEIATSNLAAGIRRVTVERGVDPRSCALMCFGGAGPLHAANLVRHLGLASALIPPRPGNGSAFGLLLAPVKHGVSQTFYASLDELPSPAYHEVIDRLRARALAALPDRDAEPRLEWYFALRYRGQTRELSIELDDGSVSSLGESERAQIAAAFHAKHEEEFTFAAPSEPIQLVTVRCEATLEQRARVEIAASTNGALSPAARPRDVTSAHFLSEEGRLEPHEAAVMARDELSKADVIEGPAVILDVGSTILLPPRSIGRVDQQANVLVGWRK